MIVAPQNQPLNVFMCVLSSEWNKLWVMRVTGYSGYELSVVKCASECCKAHNRERERKKACRGDSMWFLVCEVSQELTSLAHSALIDHCTKPQLNLWYNLHPNTRRRRKNNLKNKLVAVPWYMTRWSFERKKGKKDETSKCELVFLLLCYPR